ncbi:hypothetical protein DYB37_013301 [Aphanomyces astaci]|uniref:J domain-containing protein n=1 Tax=Aphanomyces astaci TaxID=112090 RepID=A0A3L6V8Q1_APHAT|nr:hypothetical protein DYB35_011914 [Aphanomyces astaci]RHZ33934.1 hypothetical protein DYB37_013301 [Aphanomyces astaci]RLO05130.1 hypothetical protein DYB28_005556 [Aphanomyces astaci]
MSSTAAPSGSKREQMDMHREYMKRYQQQASHLTSDTVKYKDFYETLGLARSATHAEIRSAYRTLALRFHPDRNPSKEAEDRWDGVPAAYAVLSNPNDRSEYDASLDTRDALVLFYSTYNPAKLDQSTIQAVIDGWHGREVELFRMLGDKYEIAPHQGTKSAKDMCDLLLPEDKAASIARDHQASADVQAPSRSLFESLLYITQGMCGCAAKTYYEVNSRSPGFIDIARNSNTPGTSTVDKAVDGKRSSSDGGDAPSTLTDIPLDPPLVAENGATNGFATAC